MKQRKQIVQSRPQLFSHTNPRKAQRKCTVTCTPLIMLQVLTIIVCGCSTVVSKPRFKKKLLINKSTQRLQSDIYKKPHVTNTVLTQMQSLQLSNHSACRRKFHSINALYEQFNYIQLTSKPHFPVSNADLSTCALVQNE